MHLSEPQHSPGDEAPVRIAIRTSPRDSGDFGMLVILAAVGLAIVFVPAMLLRYDPRLLNRVMQGALAVAVAILLVYVVANITAVVMDRQGIRLQRWHGWHRVLPWERITAIRQVSRGEAIFASFCTPWRSTHWGLSTSEVFCLQWGRRKFYFPPSEPHLVHQAVRRWRPDLLPPEVVLDNAPPVEETGNPYQAPKSD